MVESLSSAGAIALVFGVIAFACLIAGVCSMVAEYRDRKRWAALLKRRPYLSKE